MKILHIIDTLSMGGAENVLACLASGQKQRGHEVIIMPLVCPDKTPVRSKMEVDGLKVIPFLKSGSLYTPLLIFKIAKVIKQFDIVHVHLFPAMYWAAFAKVLAFSKVPMVYTEHSTNNRRRNKPLLHIVDKLVYQHGYKMIIACAEKVLESYRNAFPSVKHICFINNGIDTKLFHDALPYSKHELIGVDEDTFVVAMVARFMTMKRQDTIVEAIAKLPGNIHAIFVGGNKSDEGLVRVKNLANTLGVSERIHFLYIRNDVPRILKTSDVVVMASDYEGLSLSSIEGMAAGKPFIASNVDGLREVVDGAGVLYDNKDAEALAEIIMQLKSDSAFYSKIAHRCELRSKEYDVHTMVDSYMRVYQSVMR